MAKKHGNQIAVIGLGRFGSSLASELIRDGSEVLGIDSDPVVVQRHADDLTHVAVADTTDPETLRQLGVQQFQCAVVGIGDDLEASILTTSLLAEFGVPAIWAKAASRQHGRILERVGAHHVVLPEHEMGERVAHLVIGRMLDYVELEENYALAKIRPPAEATDRPLGETKLRAKYGVTVVGIKCPGKEFTYATPETVVCEGDILIIAGTKDKVERFAELT